MTWEYNPAKREYIYIYMCQDKAPRFCTYCATYYEQYHTWLFLEEIFTKFIGTTHHLDKIILSTYAAQVRIYERIITPESYKATVVIWASTWSGRI